MKTTFEIYLNWNNKNPNPNYSFINIPGIGKAISLLI